MSGTALLQVQQSVRSRLAQDPALGALVTAIYDHAPPSSGATFPFLVLGEKTEKDFDTFGRRGATVSLVVEIRSQSASDDELLDIYNLIRSVLHEQPFTLTGREVVDAQTTLVRTQMDPDGITRRGEVRLQVIVQEQQPATVPEEPAPLPGDPAPGPGGSGTVPEEPAEEPVQQ